MTKLKDTELRNLRQRVKLLTAESKRWQKRAKDAETNLAVAYGELEIFYERQPFQVLEGLGRVH
jgi:hypothetical protein